MNSVHTRSVVLGPGASKSSTSCEPESYSYVRLILDRWTELMNGESPGADASAEERYYIHCLFKQIECCQIFLWRILKQEHWGYCLLLIDEHYLVSNQSHNKATSVIIPLCFNWPFVNHCLCSCCILTKYLETIYLDLQSIYSICWVELLYQILVSQPRYLEKVVNKLLFLLVV